jgi:heme exporter protein D
MDLNDIDWMALLTMNGYGRFVWPAYAVTLVVLVGVLVQSVRALRRRQAALDVLLPGDRRARRGGQPRAPVQRPAAPANPQSHRPA